MDNSYIQSIGGVGQSPSVYDAGTAELKPIELRDGDVFTAKILYHSDESANLKLGSGDILRARLEGSLALEEGDVIQLAVTNKGDGKIVLTVIDNLGKNPDPNIFPGPTEPMKTPLDQYTAPESSYSYTGGTASFSDRNIPPDMENALNPQLRPAQDSTQIMKQMPQLGVAQANFAVQNGLALTPQQAELLMRLDKQGLQMGRELLQLAAMVSDLSQESGELAINEAVRRQAEVQPSRGSDETFTNPPGQQFTYDSIKDTVMEPGGYYYDPLREAGFEAVVAAPSPEAVTIQVRTETVPAGEAAQPAEPESAAAGPVPQASEQAAPRQDAVSGAAQEAGRENTAAAQAQEPERSISQKTENAPERVASKQTGTAPEREANPDAKVAQEQTVRIQPGIRPENPQSGEIRADSHTQQIREKPHTEQARTDQPLADLAGRLAMDDGKMIKPNTTVTQFIQDLFAMLENDGADGQRIREAAEKLGQKLDMLKTFLEANPAEAAKQAIVQIDRLMDGLKMFQQINQFVYMQIPIAIDQWRTNAELYVFKREKGGRKIDPADANVLIALNTESLGRIEAFLNIKGKSVAARFSMETSFALNFISERTPQLFRLLSQAGYKLSDMKVERIAQEISVTKAVETVQSIMDSSRINIVV